MKADGSLQEWIAIIEEAMNDYRHHRAVEQSSLNAALKSLQVNHPDHQYLREYEAFKAKLEVEAGIAELVKSAIDFIVGPYTRNFKLARNVIAEIKTISPKSQYVEYLEQLLKTQQEIK